MPEPFRLPAACWRPAELAFDASMGLFDEVLRAQDGSILLALRQAGSERWRHLTDLLVAVEAGPPIEEPRLRAALTARDPVFWHLHRSRTGQWSFRAGIGHVVPEILQARRAARPAGSAPRASARRRPPPRPEAEIPILFRREAPKKKQKKTRFAWNFTAWPLTPSHLRGITSLDALRDPAPTIGPFAVLQALAHRKPRAMARRE
jgi:hypothetical protein